MRSACVRPTGAALLAIWLVGEACICAADAEFLLKKEETWGPCPPESICRQSTVVNRDGVVTKEGRETGTAQLDRRVVEELKAAIRSRQLLTKPCERSAVADYWARYTLMLDGRSRTIELPECEDDVRALDALLESKADAPAPVATPATAAR